MKPIVVFQDGADFYNEETGQRIFRASVTVKDFDLKAAEEAREQFIEWANRHAIACLWAGR